MRVLEPERRAIDIHREKLLPIAGVPAHLQGLGVEPPHPSTVQRWLSQGVGGRRLEAVRIGGRTYTTIEAIARFAGGAEAQ